MAGLGFNLKDETEVKKYLENLSTEYRFGCFHEKKPEVCHLLADFFESINKDWDKAAKIFQVNCNDHKHGHSCHKYAGYVALGKGSLKKDHVQSLEYFDKGCEYKHPEACLNAGILRIFDIKEAKKDHVKAFQQFQKGCDLNNAVSCFYLSGMYMTGVENFLDKNKDKAFIYTKKACELGNLYACANLSQMYQKGDGIAKDEKKAEQYRNLAAEMQQQHTKAFRGITFEEGG